MQVKVYYSKIQVEEAVKFISRNNEYFLGQTDVIRDAIIERIHRVALDPEQNMVSTMGFYVNVEHREFEGIDSDQNICTVEVLVDPAVCRDYERIDSELLEN